MVQKSNDPEALRDLRSLLRSYLQEEDDSYLFPEELGSVARESPVMYETEVRQPHEVLDADMMVMGSHPDGKPMTLTEVQQKIAASEEDIQAGRVMTQEAVEEHFEQRFRGTEGQD